MREINRSISLSDWLRFRSLVPNFQRKYISRALIGCRISLTVRRSHMWSLGDRWAVSTNDDLFKLCHVCIYLLTSILLRFRIRPRSFYCTTYPVADFRINSNKKFCLSLFPLFHWQIIRPLPFRVRRAASITQPITRNQLLDANIVRESNHTPESKLWYNHMIFYISPLRFSYWIFAAK